MATSFGAPLSTEVTDPQAEAAAARPVMSVPEIEAELVALSRAVEECSRAMADIERRCPALSPVAYAAAS